MDILSNLRSLLAFTSKPQQRRGTPSGKTPPPIARKTENASLKQMGVVGPWCPYCAAPLKKKPARKKKCPSCESYIYVRTRPIDKKKILVREDQIIEVEEQWAIAQGSHDEFLAERRGFEETKKAMSARFGQEAPDADVRWSLLNKDLTGHGLAGRWGHYRNTLMQMGDHVRKEGRKRHALEVYLEVCYLDLNGPQNRDGLSDPELLRQYPHFDPEQAFLAPGMIQLVSKLITDLEFDEEKVRSTFFKIANRTSSNLDLPVSPEEAWSLLRPELSDESV